MERGNGDPLAAKKGERRVYFGELGGFGDTPVFYGDKLTAGSGLEGPCIVDEKMTTIVIPPKVTMRVDPFGLNDNDTTENDTPTDTVIPDNNTTDNVTIPAIPDTDGITGEVGDTIVENETVTQNGTLENATIKPVTETPKDTEKLPAIPKGKYGVQITDVHPLDSNKVEYVNITNYMPTTAHIEAFKLRDVACNNTLVFPADFDIKSGKTLSVYSGSGVNKPCRFYLGLKHHWINQKDMLELYCSCGNKISEFRVGDY
jgi:hypothetical protein